MAEWKDAETDLRRRWSELGLDAEMVPGSGAGIRKGDVRTRDLMGESKQTSRISYSVTEATMAKLEAQGHQSLRTGILVVTLGTGRRIYVMDAHIAEEWIEKLAAHGELQ
jgi:hypothetical protein